MGDVLTPEQRSYNMSRIKRSRTKPELMLKELLKGTYLRYQPKIYGNPDFGSKKHRIAVFVDGCFWHKCPVCFKQPATNKKFWKTKIERNVKRDKEVNKQLKKEGYDVLRFWEHQIRKAPSKAAVKIVKLLNEKRIKNDI